MLTGQPATSGVSPASDDVVNGSAASVNAVDQSQSSLRLDVPGSARPSAGELLKGATIPSHEVEALDQWYENLQKYDSTLQDMAKASVDVKFKEELGTIEQWFKLLSEAERTAAIYSLLHISTPLQVTFYIAVLQQMARSESVSTLQASMDSRLKSKQATKGVRPPSLNLPDMGVPAAPQFTAPSSNPRFVDTPAPSAGGTNPAFPIKEDKESGKTPQASPAVNVSTPTSKPARAPVKRPLGRTPNSALSLAGFNQTNPFNVIGAMGLSTEAQVLAVQMVMNGIVNPARATPASLSLSSPKNAASKGPNWRAPVSARYPGSALRSAALKTGGLNSSGLKSGMMSAGIEGLSETPKPEDVDPELLKDVPAWLKSLRLHKYTAAFDGLTWEDMVVLDEAALESRGIPTQGARKRLLRTFENVRRKMGMEPMNAPSAYPPTAATSAFPPSALAKEFFPDSSESLTPTSAYPPSALPSEDPAVPRTFV